MKEKVTIMAAKPQFIRLSDGSLMNINNIVAISEADGKVFVSAYQRIPITKEDMADVLENIEIIDDDEHPHHCGQDVRVQYDPNESQPVNVPVKGDDLDDACCQARETCPMDDGSAAVDDDLPESLKKLVGMQVVSVGDMPCDGCPVDHYGVPCVKVEIVGGTYLCLDKPQQEDAKPVISFDEEDTGKESLLDIMAEIKEKADNFMDYLDKVVINPQEQ